MPYTRQLLRHLRRAIGRNMHEFRLKKRMTLERLSQTTGVPCNRLDQYEMGKNEVCLTHLVQIACALDVDLAAFFKV
ncbi:MAG: helix-turn-helix domain-containing protein [Bdellovibrionales bacterium]